MKSKYQKIGIGFVALVAIMLIQAKINEQQVLSSGQTKEETTAEMPKSITTGTDAALAEIKAEKQVIDVIYDPTAGVEWHIGVVSDGSNRNGFANYICEVLREHGAVGTKTTVRIVDIKKIRAGNTFRNSELGMSYCYRL